MLQVAVFLSLRKKSPKHYIKEQENPFKGVFLGIGAFAHRA